MYQLFSSNVSTLSFTLSSQSPQHTESNTKCLPGTAKPSLAQIVHTVLVRRREGKYHLDSTWISYFSIWRTYSQENILVE
jgi:hypothetical protein